MKTVPTDIRTDEIADGLARHWSLEVDQLQYLPEGGGAYHWVVETEDERRSFVTCDDLDTKPWLGSDRQTVFAGLVTAYRSALELRRSAGLGFVVGPLPTTSGETAVALGPHYSLALFPFVEGKPGQWGEPIGGPERSRLVGLLGELHQSSRAGGTAPRRVLEVPGRRHLEEALGQLDRSWSYGPFSEPARRALASHAEEVAGWLATFDRLASLLGHAPVEPVVTHGEPHPGNLIRTPGGFALVDWDTVALDRPERDLWMFDDGTGSAWATYRELTGRTVNLDAVRLYRIAWALADLAAFTSLLRALHDDNADTYKAWTGLQAILMSEEPSPYGEPPLGRSNSS